MKSKRWVMVMIIALVGTVFSAQASYVTNINFKTTGITGWSVSGTAWTALPGGVAAPAVGNSKLIKTEAISSNTTYSMSTVFSFDSTGALVSSSAKDVIGIGFGVITNIHAQTCYVYLRRDPNGAQYRLLVTGRDGTNSSAANQFASPNLNSVNLCGINTNGAYSTQNLWLGMTMTRASGTSWAISATLSNMATGWSMTRADSVYTSSTEYVTKDLGAYMFDMASDADGKFANRVVSSAIITAIPEPTTIGLFLISGAGCITLRRRFFR